eukprot:5853835-Prymnesium_polylepis.1
MASSNVPENAAFHLTMREFTTTLSPADGTLLPECEEVLLRMGLAGWVSDLLEVDGRVILMEGCLLYTSDAADDM